MMDKYAKLARSLEEDEWMYTPVDEIIGFTKQEHN